jgi:excinuclease ABC subunit C
MDKFKFINQKNFAELPKASGVYSFWDKNECIYIGKAINIQNRVKSHFFQPSYRDHLYIDKVVKMGYFETNSEIEALILEASLIKKYQPKFNVIWKDDKNYFYVVVTNTERPVVFITHQKTEDAEYIGPFVEGTPLKKTLRYLRKVFPYYTVKKHPKNKCTYCHLGLCPGPDPDLKEYKKNLNKLILILQGKRNAVLNSLKKEMNAYAKANKFEDAGKVRDRILHIEQIMSHAGVIARESLPLETWDKTEQVLCGILDIKKANKIECYDISNIQGKLAVGSMVVFVDGNPDKSQYKKFRIKMENEPNDIAMLKEVLQRRFAHPEWTFPEIVLIDGGIAQLNAGINAKKYLPAGRQVKVISIAKGKQELWIENRKEPIPLKILQQEIYNLVKHLDDEAHRFAITYHKKLRKKDLLK